MKTRTTKIGSLVKYKSHKLVIFLLLFLCNNAFALDLAGVFSDHMVLQRNKNIPVWGKAQPGSLVIVNLDGSEQRTNAGSDGNWRVEFPSRTASDKPIAIKVTGDGQSVTINDILVGDVWFCSGQSNLGVTVSGAKNATSELKNADHPAMRIFTFPSGASWTTGDRPSWWAKDQVYPKWSVCTPATAAAFTAVGYVFGTELLKKTNIPIGVINAAFGGAFIEPFIPRDIIKSSGKFPKAQDLLKKAELMTAEQTSDLEIQNIKWNEDRKAIQKGTRGADEGWQNPGFDDSKWKTMPMPSFWQESAKLKIDGALWFRKSVELDATQSQSDRFSLGYMRVIAKIWINGVELSVAPEAAGLSSITYAIPPGTLKPGKNTIAFRIYSPYGLGGLKKINKEDFSLQQSGAQHKVVMDLAGEWLYEVEASLPQVPMPLQLGRTNYAMPGVIFNAMIAPFTSFPVSGIVWYQGESNVNRANEYTDLLKLLINTWRSEWKQPDLPFLIVQLPNYQPQLDQPSESNWAQLRDAQGKALVLPNTAMAVIYDAGEVSELHPRDKRTVGERLALLAEEMVYHIAKPEMALSPRVTSAILSGKTISIHFDLPVKLKTSDGKQPRGIAIAGEDKKFVWADARIKGQLLKINSSLVPSPKYIRYAWADNPDANLRSSAGLLVAPFEIEVSRD